MTKTCSACGVEKSLDDFHAHPNGAHGRTSKCKPCVSAYNKQRYARNGEAMRANMKRWREANPDRKRELGRQWREGWTDEYRAEVNARQRERRKDPEVQERERNYRREYYQANREERRAYQVRYLAEHGEKAAERIRRWKAANKDKVCHYSATRRARLKGAQGTHSYADWLNTLRVWDWACAYCGSREKLTKDHVIPLSRGGSDFIGNIVPACLSCNSAKCDRTITEWRINAPRP